MRSSDRLHFLLSIYQFSPGHAAVALGKTASVARERGDADIAEAAGRLHDVCRAAYLLHDAFRLQDTVKGAVAERGADVDQELDGKLITLISMLEGLRLIKNSRVATLAGQLYGQLSERGVAELIQLSFVDAAQKMTDVSRVLRDPTHAELFQALDMTSFPAEFDAILARLTAIVYDASQKQITWDDVQKQRAAAVDAVGEVLVRILGKYPTQSPADVEARRALTGPIRDHDEQIRVDRQRRRTAGDLNPDTGLTDGGAPDGGPSGADA